MKVVGSYLTLQFLGSRIISNNQRKSNLKTQKKKKTPIGVILGAAIAHSV